MVTKLDFVTWADPYKPQKPNTKVKQAIFERVHGTKGLWGTMLSAIEGKPQTTALTPAPTAHGLALPKPPITPKALDAETVKAGDAVHKADAAHGKDDGKTTKDKTDPAVPDAKGKPSGDARDAKHKEEKAKVH